MTTPISRDSNFYPRPPRGGRHRRRTHKQIPRRFLSTPSARRATTASRALWTIIKISIHALREEGDTMNKSMFTKSFTISIHALREEGDPVLPE